MKIKLDWSGRSHDYTTKEKNYLMKVLESDNLTQGREKNIFESSLKKYLKIKNIYSTSSAAAASTKSLTECCSPLAMTKSSGFSC